MVKLRLTPLKEYNQLWNMSLDTDGVFIKRYKVIIIIMKHRTIVVGNNLYVVEIIINSSIHGINSYRIIESR
jgi:hypothetical protein